MASNLSCLGLAVSGSDEMLELIQSVLSAAEPLGKVGGVQLFRWQDASGARIVLGFENGDVVDFLPSFDSRPGVLLDACVPVNENAAHAAVVDADGEQITAMTFELEQLRALRQAAGPVSGPASVIAFGRDVTVHADAAAFAAAPASLLDPDADPDEPPPAQVVERGQVWPPRWAAESFVSYGEFADPTEAEARARLNGVVVSAEQRRSGLTGAAFTVCRVRALDFEVDVLLDGQTHPIAPRPGAVVAGEVFLVADLDRLGFGSDPSAAPRRRRRWHR